MKSLFQALIVVIVTATDTENKIWILMQALYTLNIWYNYRDLFVLEEDGYGRFVGRIKDVIIRVVENIFSVELEEFFMNHPDILEAVVSQE